MSQLGLFCRVNWSSTHVSSSGGGGSLHRGSGYIAAPTIHSHTSTNQSVWLKDEDSNKDVKLSMPSYVDVMQGHKLKCVQLFYDNKFIDIIYIENLSTETYWTPLKIQEFALAATRKSSTLKIIIFLLLLPLLWWLYAFLIYFGATGEVFKQNSEADAADLANKIKAMI